MEFIFDLLKLFQSIGLNMIRQRLHDPLANEPQPPRLRQGKRLTQLFAQRHELPQVLLPIRQLRSQPISQYVEKLASENSAEKRILFQFVAPIRGFSKVRSP